MTAPPPPPGAAPAPPIPGVPAPSPSVSLSQLVRDATQDAYKDLHATLDTLQDASPDVRREKILDYAMRTRHRFVRLIACVQWWGDYSAFHCSATDARNASLARTAALAHAADSLWSAAQVSRGAASVAPALRPAGHILGGDTLFRPMPHLIEDAVGITLPQYVPLRGEAKSDEADAIVRLGTATRSAVRGALPAGCRVLHWRVAPSDAAVRIGVEGAWDVDFIIDRLEEEDASLRIFRLAVHVAPDSDALTPMPKRGRRGEDGAASDRRLLLSREQELLLRQGLEARMFWAATNPAQFKEAEREAEEAKEGKEGRVGDQSKIAHASPFFNFAAAAVSSADADVHMSDGETVKEKEEVDEKLPSARASRMLRVMAKCMSLEIAAVFVMDHVRAQVSALQTAASWRSSKLFADGVTSTADSRRPVLVRYWQNALTPSSITVKPGSDDVSVISCVLHEPPVLGCEMPQLCTSAVNVEALLVDSMRKRARQQLRGLYEACGDTVFQRRLCDAAGSEDPVLLFESPLTGGVELSIALKTGAFNWRLYGGVAASSKALSGLTEQVRWPRDGHFKSLTSASSVVLKFLATVKNVLHLQTLSRSLKAADMVSMTHQPPGLASSVDSRFLGAHSSSFQPPFLAVESWKSNVFAPITLFDDDPDQKLVTSVEPSEEGKVDRTDRVVRRFGVGRTRNPAVAPVAGADVSDKCPPQVSSLRQVDAGGGVVFLLGKRHLLNSFLGDERDGRPKKARMCAKDLTELMMNGSGCAAAAASSFCEITALSLRRDEILQALVDMNICDGVIEDDRLSSRRGTPHRTLVHVVADPLPVSSAELLLLGNNFWELRLTLSSDVFDSVDPVGAGEAVSYSARTQELVFHHEGLSPGILSQCRFNLYRSRCMCSLISGVDASAYEVGKQTLASLELRIEQSTMSVVFTSSGFRVLLRPAKPVLERAGQLMEELLNSSKLSAGAVLKDLLLQVCPLAVSIASAVPEDPNICRVGFPMCLRARLVFRGGRDDKKTYGIDIDARNITRVTITDLARYLESNADAAAQQRGAGQIGYEKVPGWENMLARLAEEGDGEGVNVGAAVVVSISSIAKVLSMVVASTRETAPNPDVRKPEPNCKVNQEVESVLTKEGSFV